METQTPLSIQKHYPTYFYILMPVITVYMGMFVNMSNHYVLRPKIEGFLARVSLSSQVFRELIIDFLSNMSFIAFAFCSYLLVPLSDISIRMLTFHNTIWIGLCIGVLIYRHIPVQERPCNIMTVKNALIMWLCCINVLYHYFSKRSSISLPIILTSLYIINLLINSNEEKFISFTLEMLGMKRDSEYQFFPKCRSNLPSVSYLAQKYPLLKTELAAKIKQYEAKRHNSINQKDINIIGSRITKIDTKVLVREKLLQMALSIHISHSKMEKEEISNVKQYFALANGVISEEKEQKEHSMRKIEKDHVGKQLNQGEDRDENERKVVVEKVGEPNKLLAENGQEDGDSIWLCIFPVKFFESHKMISTVVSIMVNIGFGFLLTYSQNITNTLKFGAFLEFIYGALLLPILPSMSAIEYNNAMSLASIWKFGILGLVMVFAAVSGAEASTLQWKFNSMISFHVIVFMIVQACAVGSLILEKANFKFIITVFMVSFLVNIALIYLTVNPL